MPTYYDILQVSRNAPIEVIKAAYRALVLKYHPDVNNSPEANQKMAIIQQAYETLSDPIKRAEYDKKIAQQEEEEVMKKLYAQILHQAILERLKRETQRRKNQKIMKFFIYLSVLIVAVSVVISLVKENYGTKSKPTVKTTPTMIPKEVYTRPLTDPLGNPWPTKASYLKGYKIGNADGESEITIDNTNNSSDVFVKLFSYDYDPPRAVRYFFIPAYSQFKMSNVRKGMYDIRYQDLDEGTFSKSEPFNVKERRVIYDDQTVSVQVSRIRITLYKVSGGNFHTFPIDSSQFQ